MCHLYCVFEWEGDKERELGRGRKRRGRERCSNEPLRELSDLSGLVSCHCYEILI